MKVLAIFVLALATASAVDFIETIVPFQEAAQAFEEETAFEILELPIPLKDVTLDNEKASRITNGSPANDGQFPYQAGLSLSGGVWCGGSLISSTYVLTAAHCTHGRTGGTVYLGSVARTGGTSRGITAFIRHTGYNPNTLANDVSILKIDAVGLGGNINTIRLPARSGSYSTYAGATVTISGWGRTSDNSGVSSRLNYAHATVITNADCARTYGNTVVNSGTLCISTPGGRSTCQGDSGGPAVHNGELVGVTSFVSAAGCQSGNPAGFARVTYFRDWIYSAVGI